MRPEGRKRQYEYNWDSYDEDQDPDPHGTRLEVRTRVDEVITSAFRDWVAPQLSSSSSSAAHFMAGYDAIWKLCASKYELLVLKEFHRALYDNLRWCIPFVDTSVRHMVRHIPWLRPAMWERYKLLRLVGLPRDVAWCVLNVTDDVVRAPTQKSLEQVLLKCLRQADYITRHWLPAKRRELGRRVQDPRWLLWGPQLVEELMGLAQSGTELDFQYK